MTTLTLHPDRLLPAETAPRAAAREVYAATRDLPVLSPHGHVDAAVLAEDAPFADPASLLVTPDHYVTRLLHAHGVPLERLGLRPRDPDDPAASDVAPPREVWRTLCAHWHVFAGTPSRLWLEQELHDVFGVRVRPSAETADALFDEISGRLADDDCRPRALYARFGVEALATTDHPCDDLAAHRRLADDPTWHGRVVPTFRPDDLLDVSAPGWSDRVDLLGKVADADTGTYEGFVAALEERRRFFAAHGATATDHGPATAEAAPLEPGTAARVFARARRGAHTAAEATAFRAHMLTEMARMSCEDGLVMQLHPGVVRNHDGPTYARFGPDTGHDVPAAGEFVRGLRPLLERYGNDPRLTLVLYTVDETTWSRDLAPLAGYYPAVRLGAPWWFLDAPDALARFRAAVTETAGFHKTAGFVDDTRAFCSIGARHDVARRLDAAHLGRLVAEHRLDADEAVEIGQALAYGLAKDAFRL